MKEQNRVRPARDSHSHALAGVKMPLPPHIARPTRVQVVPKLHLGFRLREL
jgi:hypothetical protein